MKNFSIFIIFLLWMSEAFADSTSLQPNQVQGHGKFTIDVLHYSPSMTFDATRGNLKCTNGTPPFAVNFFLPSSAGISIEPTQRGYFYFTCRETYWGYDAQYKELNTHTWTSCRDGTGMNCSMKILQPELIRFVATPPSDGWDTDKKSVVFHDVNLRMGLAPYVEPTIVGNTTKTMGPIIYTWYYTGNPSPWSPFNPTPESNTQLNLRVYWMLTGDTVSGTPQNWSLWSPSHDDKGLYECTASHAAMLNTFYLNINSTFYGKTCALSCEGNWLPQTSASLRRAGQPTWYSSNPHVSCH